MYKISLVLILIIYPLFAKKYEDIKVDEVISIYDGDTFKININSYPELIGKNISIRVNGVDTPELKGKCKKESFLARKAKNVTISFLKNSKVINLQNIQRDKYFRIIADVIGDDKSLGNILISEGLAVRYYGSKKIKDWCN